MEQDPVILQITHCSRKVKGGARFCCFYCIKLITVKKKKEEKAQRAGNIYRCLGELLSVFSQ